MTRASIHSFQYQLLAHRLREARERVGLTQVEVARALGRPQSFVSKAETAERRLDVFELLAFLELYGVDIDEVLSRRLTASERSLKASVAERQPQAAAPVVRATPPGRGRRRRG